MTAVRGSNPIWSFVDLAGKQFDDTFYMFVLENDLPYFPATVWHDANMTFEWTNPIQFLANGTLPVDIYGDPSQLYRLEFRQGPTQADPLIYLVEDYAFSNGSGGGDGNTGIVTNNQITNPQFALISISNPLTLTSISTQSIDIGPGWFLDLTGTGNVTLSQIALNSNSSNPTNAPYALNIQLSGSWTNAVLRQRFSQNGMLWASNSPINNYVACSVTALVTGASQIISAQMVDSLGNTLSEVLPITVLNGQFNEYTGVGLMSKTVNTDNPPAAYVDFILNLPTSIDLTITSIQLVSSNVEAEYAYEQTTIQRQIDQVYHEDYPVAPIGEIIDLHGFGTPLHYYRCDGSLKNRITDYKLFNTLTNIESVSLLNTSNTFTVADGNIYAASLPIEGLGIQAGTVISSITGNIVTISLPATATGISALRFFSVGNGDGATTFNLPDYRGYVTAGAGGTLFSTKGIGAAGGEKAHALTAAENGPHNHASPVPGSNFWIDAGGSGSPSGAGTTGRAAVTASSGNGDPHNNVQPTILVNKLIRYE